MEALTGKQRISAAFKKTFSDADPELDRVPAYIFTGACNAQLIDATISDFLQDQNVFVNAQVAAYERYQPDILLMMRDLLMSVEAFGTELKFPDGSMCMPTTELLEDKTKLSSLKVPDPQKDGRLPDYIQACIDTKEKLPDAIISGIIAGPWTIAVGLRGATPIILDSKSDPEFIHNLMEICTQASIAFTEALTEIGVGNGLSEAPASCDLISPDMYRTFVLPYHQQIVQHFKGKVGLHVCGNADPIIEDLVGTGTSNISIDSGTDMAKAAEAARGKSVLIGNVDTNMFIGVSKEEMGQAIQACLDAAPTDSGYILATGCEVPTIAPPEKVDWFMELAAELGTYQ